jgi:phosphoglucosamine mutase
VGQGIFAGGATVKFGRALGYLFKKTRTAFLRELPREYPGPRLVLGDRLAPDFILIGRDTRGSGPEIQERLVEGFMSFSVPVAYAGVVPTPALSHLVRAWGAALGIMITASHNPAEYNGIKLFSPSGLKTPDETEKVVEDLYTDEIFGTKLQKSDTLKIIPPKDLSQKTGAYTDWLVSLGGKCLAGMKLVVDCANGAMSEYAPRTLQALGAKTVVLNDVPDGENVNRNCGALFPEGMQKAVTKEKAHAGLAFDGDGDRAVFADETGQLRDGDFVLALTAQDLAAKKKLPGSTVVSTVMANFGLESFLRERGIKLLRTEVGDKFVTDAMLEKGAALGGEPSGHVLFFDTAPAGDGLLTAIRFLSLAAGKPLSKLCAGVKKVPQTLLNVPALKRPPIQSLARAAIESAKKDLGSKGRVLVRYSGTEPVCRVMVEGEDRVQVEKIAKSVADAVRKEVT